MEKGGLPTPPPKWTDLTNHKIVEDLEFRTCLAIFKATLEYRERGREVPSWVIAASIYRIIRRIEGGEDKNRNQAAKKWVPPQRSASYQDAVETIEEKEPGWNQWSPPRPWNPPKVDPNLQGGGKTIGEKEPSSNETSLTI